MGLPGTGAEDGTGKVNMPCTEAGLVRVGRLAGIVLGGSGLIGM